MGPHAVCSADRETPLSLGWRYAALPADAALSPEAVDALQPEWLAAAVPGSAAGALRAAGRWGFDQPRDFDAEDGWWICDFAHAAEPGRRCWLRFEGLATLAEVWLNGEKILSSENQFLAHEVEVGSLLKADNRLHLRCAALNTALKRKRPRPRWKTRLVRNQQLRWLRTPLLGRIPEWTPPVTVTGPWRGVSLIERGALRVLQAHFANRIEGDEGVQEVSLRIELPAGLPLHSARLEVGADSAALQLQPDSEGCLRLQGSLRLPGVRRWWPHSHGEPALYPVRLRLQLEGQELSLDYGRTGFRELRLDTRDEGFALQVNGVELFCRGVCWMPTDVVTLGADEAALGQTLDQLRAAGLNLLRVCGTTIYESQRFYEACAERGIMVWQEYPFANLDYPGEDAVFADSVRAEAVQFLARTQLNPALCLLCGNSEVEQQVAMLGMPREMWRAPLFAELLPAVGAEWRPDLPYAPSSPYGGALPFQTDAGLSHYYGVSAYLRPLEDARRADLRFASECLAFGNIPEPETIELFMGSGELPPQHPHWKARMPRSADTGWDFDDVRDFYLQRLYGVDPVRLRYAEVERYLYLSRLVVGEVMAATLSEWRRPGSRCRGALILQSRDFWPAPGWGLIDSTGLPKASYYFVKRVCAPVAVLITDEGLNGLALHAVNDCDSALPVRLKLSLYRHGATQVASGEESLLLPARGGCSRRGDALIGHFTDMSHAFRFGPPGHQFAHVQLFHADSGERLAQGFHIPDFQALASIGDPGLQALATALPDGRYALEIRSERFAHGVWVDARGFEASDNYFHLAPGDCQRLLLSPRSPKARLQAFVQASTSLHPVRVALAAAP